MSAFVPGPCSGQLVDILEIEAKTLSRCQIRQTHQKYHIFLQARSPVYEHLTQIGHLKQSECNICHSLTSESYLPTTVADPDCEQECIISRCSFVRLCNRSLEGGRQPLDLADYP
jgi:hypothetical protein